MEPSPSHEYFGSVTSNEDIEFKHSKDSYLIDQRGKKYIDFTMGWCVGNIGWNNKEVVKAIKGFDGPTYVSPHLEYKPWEELSELLAEMTPGKLKKCFRATGGTEAVEIALQAAMAYTGRKKIIAIDDAYHGNSIATWALVSDSPFFNWKRIKPPLNEHALKTLENLLKDNDVAAFIMEPVVLNLDVLVPDQKFMKGMQELCKKHGTLIIMDEVATGFGRTGKMFASDHFNIEPDIMCLAKGITGGAAALGATIMTEQVAKALYHGQFPYSTYGWHPLSVEAALTNIRYLQRNWGELEENIFIMNEYFMQRLSLMDFRVRPKISSMGLAIHVGFEQPKYAREISQKAFENGLIISQGISMYPALNIDFETAKEGLDLLEKSF
ncbi:MAG: aspartate aminotransferase family protein [Bacteriovoracaceae bacterium]|nr:aspartate aminotransferase family protein [Bacteriovoracaceae bacterium]